MRPSRQTSAENRHAKQLRDAAAELRRRKNAPRSASAHFGCTVIDLSQHALNFLGYSVLRGRGAREDAMLSVMVSCPRTGQPMYTAMETEET